MKGLDRSGRDEPTCLVVGGARPFQLVLSTTPGRVAMPECNLEKAVALLSITEQEGF